MTHPLKTLDQMAVDIGAIVLDGFDISDTDRRYEHLVDDISMYLRNFIKTN